MKNQWYKSKGGWIGALIPTAYLVYTNVGINISKLFNFKDLLVQSLLSSIFVFAIIGFIIGHLIQNKFFKKRR